MFVCHPLRNPEWVTHRPSAFRPPLVSEGLGLVRHLAGCQATSRALLTASAGFAGMKLPGPRDQATLRRKASIVRDRLLADAKKKTKQVERMLGNAAPVSSSAKKKAKEAELLAKNNAKVRDTDVMTMEAFPGGGPSYKSWPCRSAPSLHAVLNIPHLLRAQWASGCHCCPPGTGEDLMPSWFINLNHITRTHM